MKKTALHILIMGISVALIFLWVASAELSYYSLQLTAILLLTLIITHRILKPSSFKLAESTISTMAVLLITNATGGLTSPLFFLNYFILFELSLLLEPLIAIAVSVLFLLFYFLTAEVGYGTLTYLELLAFPLITPFAYFFGSFYFKSTNQKREIRTLSKKVEVLEEKLVSEEMSHLKRS
ncbi:hypothetical protein HYW55_00990 [Candidatus Gottesmanbacteria bacterium]|nr:hypothetical protein [Candidatus Gottesmanbacteria bacterium]